MRFNRQYKSGCEPALLQGTGAVPTRCWSFLYCPTLNNLNIHAKARFVGNPENYLSFFRSKSTRRALNAEVAPSIWAASIRVSIRDLSGSSTVVSLGNGVDCARASKRRVLLYSGVLDFHYNYLALDAWTREMRWPRQLGAEKLAPLLVPWVPQVAQMPQMPSMASSEAPWGHTRQVGNLTIFASHRRWTRDYVEIYRTFARHFSRLCFGKVK